MTSVSKDLAPTVSPREVGEQLRAGRRVRVIDVRTRPEYDGLHAEGAELFPLDGLDLAAVTAGGGDEPLYVSCKSGARSANACARFRAAGYGNVFSIEGGTEAWEAAGLTVVRGERGAVMSIEQQVRVAAGSLVLIGVMLVAEGVGAHMDKKYIYFAMAFSLVVEMLNMRLRTVRHRKKESTTA